MLWVKRLGWGVAALLVLLAVAFASMVRITFNDPAPQPAAPVDRAETVGARSPSGPLIIPVEGVRASQLADSWGDERGGGMRSHRAIDILAPEGTPVRAAAAGIVEKRFESEAGGNTFYIRTGDGRTVHYYAHLATYGVNEGQAVRAGDRIATVGSTGSASGGAPHLHFEIKTMQPGERWWQGVNVNPYPLLARIGDRS
ncbi:M23 family metallopeptidase [Sphingomonas hengshuiensis]|uniref:M23ase beta-sheet core domain-containing protein n=1 Tax=Sphingomonas hengshuiensis TaxID=1609977 RepID=A0A7U4J7Y0_9SPHN|nr:M23 family metallopeptidase [Sphingomonas hengshuiensis]AJP71881.1 hypothetical protein TS85_08905 [Sphingomonas hengshuiensis]